MSAEDQLRADLLQVVQSLPQLTEGCSGNVSVRTDGGFMITPSGCSYTQMKTADLVCCDADGEVIRGSLPPSTEGVFHRHIYARRGEVNAIVHVHSPYATAIACTRRGIPAFHYMVAVAGGEDIRCAEYATFGTEALAENALSALQGRLACLLANHGMIALGADIMAAWEMAQEVENLARQYFLSCLHGTPAILDTMEMQKNLEKFQQYRASKK